MWQRQVTAHAYHHLPYPVHVHALVGVLLVHHGRLGVGKQQFEQLLGPHHAVDGLFRRAATTIDVNHTQSTTGQNTRARVPWEVSGITTAMFIIGVGTQTYLRMVQMGYVFWSVTGSQSKHRVSPFLITYVCPM